LSNTQKFIGRFDVSNSKAFAAAGGANDDSNFLAGG